MLLLNRGNSKNTGGRKKLYSQPVHLLQTHIVNIDTDIDKYRYVCVYFGYSNTHSYKKWKLWCPILNHQFLWRFSGTMRRSICCKAHFARPKVADQFVHLFPLSGAHPFRKPSRGPNSFRPTSVSHAAAGLFGRATLFPKTYNFCKKLCL